MAGHRRGTGQPKRSAARLQRRRALLTDRLGRADGPGQQVAAAADYVRAVVAVLPPSAAARLADELVQTLVVAADQAAKEHMR